MNSTFTCSLAGEWRLTLPGANGESDCIFLPSTTEQSGKGEEQIDRSLTLHLSRRRPVCGACRFSRDIVIPESWTGMPVELVLERTKFTTILLDGQPVSSSLETLIPQRHLLFDAAVPGKHSLCIIVDNDLTRAPSFPDSLMNGHQYTDHTQSNWNGILGDIYMEALPQQTLRVGNVMWTPDGYSAQVTVSNRGTAFPARLVVEISRRDEAADVLRCVTDIAEIPAGTTTLTVAPEQPLSLTLWDEFSPALYELVFTLFAREETAPLCSARLTTGFRSVKVERRRILINGTPVFLRGTVDCAIFAKDGAPSFSVDAWLSYFETLRTYGLNHCRFHSWCPPDAAFAAADRLGIYLQVELSCFANALWREGQDDCDPVLNRYLREQSARVLETYGNHPSFLLFAVGNEMVGEPEAFAELIRTLRELRPDKLYTQGSNNFLEQPVCSSEDDVWITMRTSPTDNIRASFSHGDLPLGHIQLPDRPSTRVTYRDALERSALPLIAHEIGQFQTFPDCSSDSSFDGVFYPSVLPVVRERLSEKGLLAQADDFHRASGALAVQCYREDIEAQLRTEGMTGFQLLGIQDFPGQGSAFVGILDAFMQSKGLIEPAEWRRFCAPQVVLAQFDSYILRPGEAFTADLLVVNFGAEPLPAAPLEAWFSSVDGEEYIRTNIPCAAAPRGGWTKAGTVSLTAPNFAQAQKIALHIRCGAIENEYSLWVMPDVSATPLPENVHIMTGWDEQRWLELPENSRIMLFLPHAAQSVEGFFPTDFWCYPMFRDACVAKGLPIAPGTMGLLCDPTHPALHSFPTESFSSWQWHSIVTHCAPVILDDMPDCVPLVQVIDNFDRNHRLGLVWEMKIGPIPALICAADLPKLQSEFPEAGQLLAALSAYVGSEAFAPNVSTTTEAFTALAQE